MGKVYLGNECIGEMYTQRLVEYYDVIVEVLKKPLSRYMVDENGVAKTIEGDVTGAFDDAVTIGDYGLHYSFYGCTGLTGSVSFPKLMSVGADGLYGAFYNCTELTGSVNFPELTSVGNYGLRYAFYNCTGITSVNFHKLTSVGTYGLYDAFYKCTNITEIHFRADVKDGIEGLSGYSSKFGATNATIYFDL